MPPFVLAALVCFAGIFSSRRAVIYWQLGLTLLGAAAAFQLPNGATVTPPNLFLPFLAWHAFAATQNKRYLRHVPTAGVWLGLAAAIGIICAYFVPRMFEGQLLILTADRDAVGGPKLYPLHPVSTNLTQSIYAVGGVVCFLGVRALIQPAGGLRVFRDAVLFLALLDCIAALINLAEFHLGLPPVLEYVRTAYALFGAYEGAGGLMRIHGTFSEASSFAAFTMPLFAFCFFCWMDGQRRTFAGCLALLLLALLLVSTSSTALAGLAIYSAIVIFTLTYRGYVRGSVPQLGLLFAWAQLSLVVIGSLFVLETSISRQVSDYFSVTLFSKLDSSSGVERASWNTYAWDNFIQTYGLGVGLGTARASSFPLVLLSNIGMLGTLAYLMFLLSLFPRRQVPKDDEDIHRAARQAVLAALCASCVSQGVYDMGNAFYAFAGAASSTALQARPAGSVQSALAQPGINPVC